MFGDSHIQVGAGRYIQCHGALNRIGDEVSFFGKKIFLLFSDDAVKDKTWNKIQKSLEKTGIEYLVYVFEGPSTEKNFLKIAKELEDSQADMIAGIGGGRILDIAKAAGDLTGKSIFTVPTCAATCAAYAVLYVVYGEDGSVERSGFLQHEIRGVIVDMDIVANDCPVRYLVSGIADAMAKKPEFMFTMMHLGEKGMAATSDIATLIASYTYQKYTEIPEQALKDMEEKKDNLLLDNIINMNIMLTGMVSDLSTGGKQLAIAHNFYDAICCLHKDIRSKYLHGEIVGMALPLQIAVNGGTKYEIMRLKQFLDKIGIPVSLKQAGFPEDKEKLERLITYIHKKTIESDIELLEQIRTGMKYIM